MKSSELYLIVRQLIEAMPPEAPSNYNHIHLSKNYLPNDLEERFKDYHFHYFNHWFIGDAIYLGQNMFMDED